MLLGFNYEGESWRHGLKYCVIPIGRGEIFYFNCRSSWYGHQHTTTMPHARPLVRPHNHLRPRDRGRPRTRPHSHGAPCRGLARGGQRPHGHGASLVASWLQGALRKATRDLKTVGRLPRPRAISREAPQATLHKAP